MKEIKLTQGKVALVDDEDFDYLNQFKWHVSSNGYARKNGKMVNRIKAPITFMHRDIAKPQGSKSFVDHINGDKLDNRKANLRICTNAENTRNGTSRGGSSGYKGVTWYKRDKCWHARIKVDYKTIHLGYFNDERKAAQAYNKAAIIHHRNFAKLNEVTYELSEVMGGAY